ncbi:MAG: FHA domain-containing protein [Lentisphaerae bacterium]|nr:FHA domain-containing protein [Lentisphaerota bacterium]
MIPAPHTPLTISISPDRKVVVRKLPFLVGRDASNDLVLDHDSVSGLHACIVSQNGAFYIVDMASANGTFLRQQTGPDGRSLCRVPSIPSPDHITSQELGASNRLSDGMVIAFGIQLGSCLFGPEEPAAAPESDTSAPPVEPPALRQPPMLVVRSGPEPGRQIPLVHLPVTLGSHASKSQVAFPTATTVSRMHAQIFAGKQAGLMIQDLSSKNGTFVNDARVTGPRKLHHGDIITLSDEVVLHVHISDGGIDATRRQTQRYIGLAACVSLLALFLAIVWSRTKHRTGNGPSLADTQTALPVDAGDQHSPDAVPESNLAVRIADAEQLLSSTNGWRAQSLEEAAQMLAVQSEEGGLAGTLPALREKLLRRVRSMQATEIAMNSIQKGHVALAEAALRTALQEAPENPTATTALEALGCFTEYVNSLDLLVLSGSAADTRLLAQSRQKTLLACGNSRVVSNAMERCLLAGVQPYAERLLGKAKEASQSGAFLEALQVLRLVDRLVPGQPDIRKAVDALETQAAPLLQEQVNRAYGQEHAESLADREEALKLYRELVALCDESDWTGRYLRLVEPRIVDSQNP